MGEFYQQQENFTCSIKGKKAYVGFTAINDSPDSLGMTFSIQDVQKVKDCIIAILLFLVNRKFIWSLYLLESIILLS